MSILLSSPLFVSLIGFATSVIDDQVCTDSSSLQGMSSAVPHHVVEVGPLDKNRLPDSGFHAWWGNGSRVFAYDPDGGTVEILDGGSSREFSRQILEFFGQAGPLHSMKYLELGCGAGSTVRAAAAHFSQVFVIDAIRENLDNCKRSVYESRGKANNVVWFPMNLYENPTGWAVVRENGPYDMVFIDANHGEREIWSDVVNVLELLVESHSQVKLKDTAFAPKILFHDLNPYAGASTDFSHVGRIVRLLGQSGLGLLRCHGFGFPYHFSTYSTDWEAAICEPSCALADGDFEFLQARLGKVKQAEKWDVDTSWGAAAFELVESFGGGGPAEYHIGGISSIFISSMLDYFMWLRLRFVATLWGGTYLVWHRGPQANGQHRTFALHDLIHAPLVVDHTLGIFLESEALGEDEERYNCSPGLTDCFLPVDNLANHANDDNFATLGHQGLIIFNGARDLARVAEARDLGSAFHYTISHRARTLAVRFEQTLASLNLYDVSPSSGEASLVGFGVKREVLQQHLAIFGNTRTFL